jgi:hypothetical protein
MKKQLILKISCLAIITSTMGCNVSALSQTVWHPETVLTGSSEDGGNYGRAVAIDGDTVVVGAPNHTLNGNPFKEYNAGVAYVYTHSGTSWVQQAKLIADDAHAGNEFGSSLAIGGNTIAVAVRFKAVYVFQKIGSTWVQQAKLMSPDHTDSNFASAVAIDGNTIVIGSEGAAYTYERDPATATWSFQTKLPPKEEGVVFGPAVAIEGNTIVVGRGEYGGSVDVFVRSAGSKTRHHQALLSTQELGYETEGFGHAVAIHQGRILVGASSERSILDPYPVGAAHLYERDAKTGRWVHRARLLPEGLKRGTFPYGFGSPRPYGFGSSVSISGDVAVVGARSVRWPVPSPQSAAFVYRLDEKTGQWQQQAKIEPELEDRYINSVAVSEHDIVVGDTVAKGKNNIAGEGAAYVFDVQEPKLQR